MTLFEQIKEEISEFKSFATKIDTMPETAFDREFHDRLLEIEILAQKEPENRQAFIGEFLTATSRELGMGIMSRHIRIKPFGYAGDHLAIDMIYQQCVAESQPGRILDEFFHRQMAPRAVRNRKTFFIDTIMKLCHQNTTSSVLDIACGPCRDVAEALSSVGDAASSMTFHCIDMDPRAIDYARTVVGPEHTDGGIRWETANALRLRMDRRHDLVWSAGLFDYLNDKSAAALLKRMWNWTAEGGEVIVGNFHTSNPVRPWMEWCGDWHLIHRDEEDMRRLCRLAGIPLTGADFHYEPEGINMFLMIAKG